MGGTVSRYTSGNPHNNYLPGENRNRNTTNQQMEWHQPLETIETSDESIKESPLAEDLERISQGDEIMILNPAELFAALKNEQPGVNTLEKVHYLQQLYALLNRIEIYNSDKAFNTCRNAIHDRIIVVKKRIKDVRMIMTWTSAELFVALKNEQTRVDILEKMHYRHQLDNLLVRIESYRVDEAEAFSTCRDAILARINVVRERIGGMKIRQPEMLINELRNIFGNRTRYDEILNELYNQPLHSAEIR
jgi:hypothetical protein